MSLKEKIALFNYTILSQQHTEICGIITFYSIGCSPHKLWMRELKEHWLFPYFMIYGTLYATAMLSPLLPSCYDTNWTWRNCKEYFCLLKLHVNKLHSIKTRSLTMFFKKPTNAFVRHASLESGLLTILLLVLSRFWDLWGTMLQGKCLGVTYASRSIFITRSEQMALRCYEVSSMMEKVSKEEQGKPELLITKKKAKIVAGTPSDYSLLWRSIGSELFERVRAGNRRRHEVVERRE